MGDEIWDEHQYKNWVRGAKGLEFLQDGLKDFIGNKAPICRDQLLQRIGCLGSVPTCNQCTSQNLLPEHANGKKACSSSTCIERAPSNCFGCKPRGRRKCPNGVCSKLYDAIVLDHRYNSPLWKSTDPNTWCTDLSGWSFAKCFQTTLGSATSAQDTDAAGLLSYLINNLSMQNWLACHSMGSKTVCRFQKAKDIRNDILHKAKMELDDQTLDEYLDVFIAVLQDPKHLVTNAASQDAVNNLTRLKSKQIHISQWDETKVRKIREDALAELDEATQDALKEIKDMAKTGIADVNKTKSEGVQEIKDTTSSGLSDVVKTKSEAVKEIKDRTASVLSDVNNVLSDVNNTKSRMVQEIKDTTTCGLSNVSKRQSEAVQEIEDTKISGLSDVKKTKLKAVQNIEDTTMIGMSVINKTKSEAVQEIKDTTRSGLTDVIKTKSEAVQELKDTSASGLSDVKKITTQAVQEIEGAKSNALEELEKQQRMIVTPANMKPTSSLDMHYSNTVSELQEDLISFYRRYHTKISISPLLEEDSTPLLDFYVMPTILLVNVKRSRDGAKEEKHQIETFRDVFYKDDKMCSEIYLTADAGLGKTALSKRFALTWCHAKKSLDHERRYFSDEEINALKEFRFVFFVLLRNSTNECEIDDLIMNQIVSRLARRYTLDNLENILVRETCLVILDGLDEWNHQSNSCKQGRSSIPHRKVRENTVILTTTRPWKLSVGDFKSSQIDQKLEITGLNEESANKLKRSMISHLFEERNEDKLKTYVTEFTTAVGEKRISDLEAIPLLLIYLLFLWYYKIELGQSQCDLYSSIVELLISRSNETFKAIPLEIEVPQVDIPQSFTKQTHCRKFYPLLTALGKLAYKTLYGETGSGNTLVFKSSVAEQFLNKDCLNFCLRTGIITKSKVPRAFLEQISKVSFAHKTVQEFFAALYIRSVPDESSVPETVLSNCKCVADILEMSKILIFLSGFNVNVSSSISRKLMRIINEDEITREYRSTPDPYCNKDALKQFQDMCVSCCKELPNENAVSLCLQDVFIDESFEKNKYRENLKQLIARNKQNIKSVYIDANCYAWNVFDCYALWGLENIEKIDYRVEYEDCDSLPLERAVKSLCLSNLYYWPFSLHTQLATLLNLEAICIDRFNISHKYLIYLCNYISQRHCMRQIKLRLLHYTEYSSTDSGDSSSDSEDSSIRCSLDLSQHSQLRKITLVNIPVSELNINMSSLKECELQDIWNPDLVLRFMNCVPADNKVEKFYCESLESSAAIETTQQTLPLLVHVNKVRLWSLNLGNEELLTSEMVNIKSVEFWDMKMPASVLRGIVAVLQQLPQTVSVILQNCSVTPESEFVRVKEEIKQSSAFSVTEEGERLEDIECLEDSEDVLGKYLTFETIRDSG